MSVSNMKDYRKNPIEKIVAIGESNSYGMCAIDPRNEWIQTIANLIRDFQEKPLEVVNNSIPASVISPSSPGYKDSIKPSALERYDKDLISQDPDLAIVAYGLNDSRCGYDAKKFARDLEKIIKNLDKKTESLKVITSPYWNTQHNPEIWEKLENKPNYDTFGRVNREPVRSYIPKMKSISKKHNCLFVDLFSKLEGATWLLHGDQVHYTDVGQRILGQIVFNKIASSCSFIGKKSIRQSREGNFDATNTGGTRTKWDETKWESPSGE